MTGDTFDRFSDRPRGRFGDNESQRADRVEKSNLCDLDLILHNDNPTKLAIAVSLNPDTPFAHWAWLPRSLIEYEVKSVVRSTKVVRVTLPESYAHQKGLI